jgi:hypothetical protein
LFSSSYHAHRLNTGIRRFKAYMEDLTGQSRGP